MLICVRSLLTGEELFKRLYPGQSWELHYKLEYLVTYLSVPVFLKYIRTLYPDELQSWAVKTAWAIYGALALTVMLTAPRFFTMSLHVFILVSIAAIVYVLYALALAVRRKRDFADVTLAVGIIFCATVIHDFAYYQYLKGKGELLPFGLSFFIVAQAFQLSVRFSRALDTNKRLEQVSLLDGLTNIPNRRHFDAAIRREWASAVRNGTTLSIIVLDIDKFKEYNDNLGHLEGDACIRQVAEALQEGLKRPRDLVARYGGEEFAIILPETSSAAALLVAEQLRTRIEALQLPHPTRGIVTISLGLSAAAPKPGDSYEPLLQEADDALYASKRSGRNRVSRYSPVEDRNGLR